MFSSRDAWGSQLGASRSLLLVNALFLPALLLAERYGVPYSLRSVVLGAVVYEEMLSRILAGRRLLASIEVDDGGRSARVTFGHFPATTVTAVTATGTVAGGAILPGYGLWAEMLASRTAQLPKVDGPAPKSAVANHPLQ